MRKIIFACVFAILICSSVFAATSDDVYLRRDVFDAKMDSFMSEMRLMFEQNRREIEQKFEQRIGEVEQKFEQRIGEVEQKFDKRFEKNDQRFDKIEEQIGALREQFAEMKGQNSAIQTSVYWILGAVAVIVATPYMQKFLQWYETKQQHEHEPLLTNDELQALRRLLAMNEARFAGK